MNQMQKDRFIECKEANECGVYFDCSGCICNSCVGHHEDNARDTLQLVELINSAVAYFKATGDSSEFAERFLCEAKEMLEGYVYPKQR